MKKKTLRLSKYMASNFKNSRELSILNQFDSAPAIAGALSQDSQLPWWVVINNHFSNYNYYFGPFTEWEEAALFHCHYMEDTVIDQPEEIKVVIKQCQPENFIIRHPFRLPSKIKA
ncbi:DUF1816 domain-containing protein [Gloeothece verrucosa]|uniref:Uncharacterized protein n=1 Tax=Gloeothece verrucosa (strain PCC 7822) TaxID=497965 RepID=E0UK22_GLOV7|nr:DUF1816 domain-containing protein [Gloeothece verrucosa]ADN14658.1 hypothetical protein Cyan7822_2691 [Gloeothece verrucosa PCC 7822]